MKIPQEHQGLAQLILNERAHAGLEADGIFGAKSVHAAQKWIVWEFRGKPTYDRWCAATLQKEALLQGFYIGKNDAHYGEQTADAAERITFAMLGKPLAPRPDETTPDTPRCWSPTTKQMTEFYGAVGTNQVYAACPYKLRLDWDMSSVIERFSCHAKVKDRAEKAMREVLAHYGEAKIRELGLDRFGGCLNVRKKRGGSSWSTHAWGAAIDWLPSLNQLRETKKTARFARPEYRKFMEIWADNGFMSLGRCYDFDWQHVQMNPH